MFLECIHICRRALEVVHFFYVFPRPKEMHPALTGNKSALCCIYFIGCSTNSVSIDYSNHFRSLCCSCSNIVVVVAVVVRHLRQTSTRLVAGISRVSTQYIRCCHAVAQELERIIESPARIMLFQWSIKVSIEDSTSSHPTTFCNHNIPARKFERGVGAY